MNSGGDIKLSSYSSLYCFRFYGKLKLADITMCWGNYLQRRSHASNGSFNPYIITNKEANIINGNVIDSNIKNNKATSVRQLCLETNDNRRHFMNYCFTHPGRYSCAVDSFLELAFAIFRDSLQHIERNEFFSNLVWSMFTFTQL